MRIYKTRPFSRWADNEGLTDPALFQALPSFLPVLSMRILAARSSRSVSGCMAAVSAAACAALIAFQLEDKASFLYGFAKNERENIDNNELKALRLLAAQLLSYTRSTLIKAIRAGKLIEVTSDEQDPESCPRNR